MKNKLPFLAAVSLITIAVSCGNKKSAPATDVYKPEQIKILQDYPKLNGYMPHVVTVPKKDDESLYKVQIVPGKTMEIDCNKHGLQGKYERKMLSNGDTYFVFLSKGEVFSTMMGCPDNTKRMSFVPGPTIFTEYNSQRPFVAYTPTNLELKYRIWEAKEVHDVSKTIDPSIQTEATKELAQFPEKLDGYDRYVLLLPSVPETHPTEQKIEIIPGITREADCNIHSLNGTFSKETIEGFGYEYLVFKSDGNYASTRMACPDNSLTSQFISGETELVPYNSQLPIVIFAPKGFEVKYRVWESEKMGL